MQGIVMASCEEEQEWNEDQLRDTVSQPAFRLWTYGEPAVVLGCSQRHLVTPEEIEQRAGIGAVVRQAGGGAVLAGPWMLSASVVLPNSHPLASSNLIQSYRWIGELHAMVLQRLGIAARAIDAEEAKSLQQESLAAGLGWACFGGFSPWEVVVGQRKIVGLAQVRRRTGTLFVAGLLLDRPEWGLLSRAMNQYGSSDAKLAARTTSCAEQLGRDLSIAQVASPLADALQAALGQA
jgi:lipoate-protein ligase A